MKTKTAHKDTEAKDYWPQILSYFKKHEALLKENPKGSCEDLYEDIRSAAYSVDFVLNFSLSDWRDPVNRSVTGWADILIAGNGPTAWLHVPIEGLVGHGSPTVVEDDVWNDQCGIYCSGDHGIETVSPVKDEDEARALILFATVALAFAN